MATEPSLEPLVRRAADDLTRRLLPLPSLTSEAAQAAIRSAMAGLACDVARQAVPLLATLHQPEPEPRRPAA